MAINPPIKVIKVPEEISQEEPQDDTAIVTPPAPEVPENKVLPETDPPVEDGLELEPCSVVINDKSPCNWKIEGDEKGITAINYLTGETFIGNPRDFYRALRG